MARKRKVKPRRPCFQVFESVNGEWCWRLVARNGKTVADGAESYKRRGEAVRAVKRVITLCSSFERYAAFHGRTKVFGQNADTGEWEEV